mgnify:CR=1 FL=1
MIKRIVVGFLLIFLLNWNTFAESQAEMEAKAKAQSAQSVLNSATQNYNDAKATFDANSNKLKSEQWKLENCIWCNEASLRILNERIDAIEAPYKNAEKLMNEAANKTAEANSNLHKTQCWKWWSSAWKCIDQPTFTIWVDETIWVWFKVGGKDTSQVINYTLGTVIQKLMIALWVLAVLIMTIWGGYIILYHGQDELLSKGKSIFMSGVTALVVALSSYYIVAILRYILYK